MHYRYSVSIKIIFAVCLSLYISGCASKTASIDFTRSELRLIPNPSLHNLMSLYSTETSEIVIETINKKTFRVKNFIDKDYAIVTANDGNDINITFSDIDALKLVKKIQTPKQPSNMTTSGAVDAAAEALAYAPIVPLAVGTWPLLRAMGLDAQKNSDDGKKARLIYVGLSKTSLIQSIGNPKIKYHCLTDQEKNELEIWVYENEKVLRGGRALFIDVKDGTVYHNSFHTTFFMDSEYFRCSQIE